MRTIQTHGAYGNQQISAFQLQLTLKCAQFVSRKQYQNSIKIQYLYSYESSTEAKVMQHPKIKLDRIGIYS